MSEFFDNDDDFFHLTCHIDSSLREKIERGEFVDLERLLPSNRYNQRLTGDSRMELVNRDGVTYFVPATDRENKITGIRKWEQAFRVYAAIYCKENPSRSAEIWQYIYTINTAASAFQWDNVAWYDFTFRQLMAAKPHHSWAKTYAQFWNLAMRNPLGASNSQTFSSNLQARSSQGHPPGQISSRNGHKKCGDWRDNCCWHFNRTGKCTRSGCRFENRCSYCGSYSHYLNICQKAAKRNSPAKSGNINNNNSKQGNSK